MGSDALHGTDQAVYNTGRTISVAGPNFAPARWEVQRLPLTFWWSLAINNTTSFSDFITLPPKWGCRLCAFMDPYPRIMIEEPDIVALGIRS